MDGLPSVYLKTGFVLANVETGRVSVFVNYETLWFDFVVVAQALFMRNYSTARVFDLEPYRKADWIRLG